MWTIYLILAGILISASIFSKIPNQHWIFRVCDFAKLQIFGLMLITLVLGLFLEHSTLQRFVQIVLVILWLDHAATLFKYTRWYKVKNHRPSGKDSQQVSIISANVYQFNTQYHRFIDLIRQHQPDIFLTMESNGDWEQAMRELESDYPFQHKVSLENTYGMHLYSRLPIEQSQTHYFVSDDLPSIQAHFKTPDGYPFVFFGVHPPPPSPTEESTSKERDGDLLSLGQTLQSIHKPIIIVGDFNNVSWSKSSELFRKTSGMIDPRVGHGFLSTFHAKYRWLRFPIDLMYHSKEIFIDQFKTLPYFGSDHLAIYATFFIDFANLDQHELIETANQEEQQEAQEMIEEGKKTEGSRQAIASPD